jgi:sec-independent protein translocase protein TatB
MFDIGWSEIAIIATVAIIVIGPKDLPKVLRTVGQWIGKAKAMAREFQSSIDDVIRETELDEVTKQINNATNLDVKEQINKAVDPTGELENAFKVEVPDDKKDGEDDLSDEHVEEYDDLGYDEDMDHDEAGRHDEKDDVKTDSIPEEDAALAAAEKIPLASPSTPSKES